MPVRISYEYFVIAPLAEALPGEEPCTIISALTARRDVFPVDTGPVPSPNYLNSSTTTGTLRYHYPRANIRVLQEATYQV